MGLLGLFLACAAPVPPERTYFEDLILDESRWADREQPPATASCGDETHFMLELFDGDEITLHVPLGSSPQLAVGGCVQRFDQRYGPAQASLRLWAGPRSGDDSAVREASLPRDLISVNRAQDWFTRNYDLAELAGKELEVRLELDLGKDLHFYLRDLNVSYGKPGPPPVPEPAAAGGKVSEVPQILLISVDTLRRDALGLYGSSNATPNLDALAAESQVFANHFAAATWTKPSHASLLTGHPPSVGGGMGETLDPLVATLAERLQAEGLATAGLVHDCVWLNPKFGFDRGFDEYRSVSWQLPKLVRQVANWIGDHRDRPFFFFSHNFEVHSDFHRLPYEAPGIDIITMKQRFGYERYGCRNTLCASRRLAAINEGREKLLPGEKEALRFLYGKGVEFLDFQLGLLFDELRAQGVWDNLLVVVTSDHGESFDEHGELLHTSPWQEVLQVPLIIKWPGGRYAGDRREQPTSALDVVPTLLEAYGFERSGVVGVPLLTRRRDLPVFAGTVQPVVVRESLKAVYRDGRYQLYDLAGDPGELHDLATERPADLASLEELLRGFRRSYQRQRREAAELHEHSETGSLTPEEMERLRSLGYLGGQ
ncbi:MAG: sulfatase [Acidobacteria bacterium]|nr:sulfatase [Acidobacteriota bacterium]